MLALQGSAAFGRGLVRLTSLRALAAGAAAPPPLPPPLGHAVVYQKTSRSPLYLTHIFFLRLRTTCSTSGSTTSPSPRRQHDIQRVMLLDLDVHQGDGSAAIFARDNSVFTFSIHCGAQAFPAVPWTYS
jgi:hypothetical protein